jgi:hypothetical protein
VLGNGGFCLKFLAGMTKVIPKPAPTNLTFKAMQIYKQGSERYKNALRELAQ